MEYAGGSSVTKIYGDYELVSGTWVPTTIIIERHDDRKQPPELLSRDYWDLTSVSPVLPQTNSFRAPYEADALVEFYTPISKKAFWYRYYSEVDTDSLLEKKLEIALTKDSQSQNCATMAMKYVLERLGKNFTDQELAKLMSVPDKSTSLHALRQFTRDLGLHCLAVKTDIAALKNLKGCQAILHLPAANHYIVLEYIDDEYVWVIDLDSNKFFYRTRLKEFGLTWSEGTALLVSDKPLDLELPYTEINDSELGNIIGSTEGGLTNFSCTDLIQEYKYLNCPITDGPCVGRYWIWPNMWGCEPGLEGQTCNGTDLVGTFSSACINQGISSCTITGEWITQSIRACN